MYCNNSFKIFLYFIIFMIIVFINVQLKNKMKRNELFLLFLVSGIFLIVLLNMIFKNNKESFTSNILNDSGSNMKYSSMGPFDNLILKPEGGSEWRHAPSNLPLYKPSTLYTPQGTPLPLKNQAKITTLPLNSNSPSVDGSLSAPKNMFMFAYNQCRPECCPSTFSCDHGCVCTTEQQRHFINSRGTPKIEGHAYPGI
jgi:hypothetical protein